MENKKDIRKEKTLEKVKAKLQMDLQVRRQILDLLQQIDSGEKSIELQTKHIASMKEQVDTGNIRQRDKFGNIFDKEDLPRTISIYEMDLLKMGLQLDYFKEDLFHAINVKDSVLHGRSLQEIKKYFDQHYGMVREEYKKVKEVLGG